MIKNLSIALFSSIALFACSKEQAPVEASEKAVEAVLSVAVDFDRSIGRIKAIYPEIKGYAVT